MKLTNRQIQSMFSACRSIDKADSVSLRPATRHALASNGRALADVLEAYERWCNDKLVEIKDRNPESSQDGTLGARHEIATREEGEKPVEVNIRTIKIGDLDLAKNTAIKVQTISMLGPIVEDLDDAE